MQTTNLVYSEDEITLVGIIPERDLRDMTTEAELSHVFNDALSIGPMLEPLLVVLRD